MLHDDNTLGLYGHFTHNGPLVNAGDMVTQGQPLGLSGDSGLSYMPHMHFEVVRCTLEAWSNGAECPEANTFSVPVVFRNTTPTACGLDVNTSYMAEAY